MWQDEDNIEEATLCNSNETLKLTANNIKISLNILSLYGLLKPKYSTQKYIKIKVITIFNFLFFIPTLRNPSPHKSWRVTLLPPSARKKVHLLCRKTQMETKMSLDPNSPQDSKQW